MKNIQNWEKFNVNEGRTDKAFKSKDLDVKKDAFRDKIESHFKSLKCEYKSVGDDFEAECEATKDGESIQVMFRPDYIGLKTKGDKHTQEFKYNELGKVKKEISKLLK
jgi:hypothetical protein